MEEYSKELVDLAMKHINTVHEIDVALCIYQIVKEKMKTETDTFWKECVALSTIYSIGRIDGIREERKKHGKQH